MMAKHGHFGINALVALGLAYAVPACLYDREPTGLSDVRGTHGASWGGLVYAEEHRAVERQHS